MKNDRKAIAQQKVSHPYFTEKGSRLKRLPFSVRPVRAPEAARALIFGSPHSIIRPCFFFHPPFLPYFPLNLFEFAIKDRLIEKQRIQVLVQNFQLFRYFHAPVSFFNPHSRRRIGGFSWLRRSFNRSPTFCPLPPPNVCGTLSVVFPALQDLIIVIYDRYFILSKNSYLFLG